MATKTEMERPADATKLTGVKYDINNLPISSRRFMQFRMRLGLPAPRFEAEETFTGSQRDESCGTKRPVRSLGEGLRPALEGLAQTVSISCSGTFADGYEYTVESPSAIAIFFQTAALSLWRRVVNSLRILAQESRQDFRLSWRR